MGNMSCVRTKKHFIVFVCLLSRCLHPQELNWLCLGFGLLNNAGIGEPLVLDVDLHIFYICEMNTSLSEPRVECLSPHLDSRPTSRKLKTESLAYGALRGDGT